MGNNVERILNVALTVSALSIAGLLVHRQVAQPPVRAGSAVRQGVTLNAEWKKLWDAGTLVGSTTAPIKIIEVLDLECPFCSRFNATLTSVVAAYPNEIAISYVHFPIPGHRFAMPGARAAECAGVEGKFGPFIDLVYQQPDSLGTKSWATFAREAGVQDSAGFASCLATKRFDAKIESARDAAQAADISATPTVLINGWRFATPPSEKDLLEAIKAVKSGREPLKSD